MENENKALDFAEYYNSGEETPDEIDVVTEMIRDNKESTDINEGLVDVLFKTLKTNMKVSVTGNLIYFKWEWIANKSLFTIRVRKKTLDGFVQWITMIQEYAEDGSGK